MVKRSKGRKAQRKSARQQRAIRRAAAVAASRRKPRQLKLTKTARTEIRRQGNEARLRSLALSLTLPAENPAVRYPTQIYGADLTGLFHLTAMGQPNMNDFAARTTCFMLCGSPISPVWSTVDAGHLRTYRHTFDARPTDTGPVPLNLTAVTDMNTPPCYPAKMLGLEGTWFYVPAGVNWTIRCTNFTGVGPVSVYASYMTVLGNVSSFASPASIVLVGGSGSAAQGAPAVSTWYRFDMVICSTQLNTGTVDAEVQLGRGFWPSVQCPSLSAVSPCLEKLRVNASALLLSNVTAHLQRNGGVVGARLLSTDVNVFDPTTTYTKVGVVNERLKYSGVAEKGIYTYIIPSEQSLRYSDYRGAYTITSGDSVPAVYDLLDFSHVNISHFDVNTSAASGGFGLKLRHDMHLEFVTDAEIYKLDTPKIPFADFTAIASASSAIVPFTENPVHMAHLAVMARRVLARLAPMLVPMARVAVRQGAAAANRWLDETGY